MVRRFRSPAELDIVVEFLKEVDEFDDTILEDAEIEPQRDDFYYPESNIESTVELTETGGVIPRKRRMRPEEINIHENVGMWKSLELDDVIAIEGEDSPRTVGKGDEFERYLQAFTQALNTTEERKQNGDPYKGLWVIDTQKQNPIVEFRPEEQIYLTRERVRTETKQDPGRTYYYLYLPTPELRYLGLQAGDYLKLERKRHRPSSQVRNTAADNQSPGRYISATKARGDSRAKSVNEAYVTIFNKPEDPNPQITIPKKWCSSFFDQGPPPKEEDEASMLFIEVNQPDKELRIYRKEDYGKHRIPEIEDQPHPFHDYTDVFKRGGIKMRQRLIFGND